MITAISKIQNVKSNNTSYGKKQSNIAFHGNFSNIGKNIREAKTPRINGFFEEFANKLLESQLFQKLAKNTELRSSKNPLIAATSMDPLDHTTAEQRAQLASQSKGTLGKLSDLLFGPKAPNGSVEDVLNDKTGNKISNEISSSTDNLENMKINQNASKLADSALDSSPESIHHVRPEDLVFDQDGNVVYEINPKLEAELNADKLEQLAQDASKEVPTDNVNPKNLIFDQDGNVVYKIEEDTDQTITDTNVTDDNTIEDIDTDFFDPYMGV